MSLNDLNKELYGPSEGEIASRAHEQSGYDPNNLVGQKIVSPFEQEEKWEQVQKGLKLESKKKIFIGVGIFSVILLIVAGYYGNAWWQKNAFHQDRVEVVFEGPKEADSTQPVKYLIHYKNNNRVSLRNTSLQLSYAENFQPTDNVNLKFLSPTSSRFYIGDIKPMSQGTVELKGVFYAPKDFPIYIRGTLSFTPSNGGQQLTMDNQIGVNITAAPVFLTVGAPQTVADGDAVEYVVDYKNLDIRQINGVQVRVDFPDGFAFSKSQPQPSEKNSYWYVGNLESYQNGKISIQGTMKGGEGETKDIVVSLGRVGESGDFVVFSKQELSTRVISPILAIRQKLEDNTDGIVNAGQTLKYIIEFENTGNIGLRDAIVTAHVDSKLLDYSKMQIEGGSYDAKTNTILWKASDVPSLAIIDPKAKGQVRYSIPIKTIIPIETKLDKNLVILSTAKIDSPDIPTPINSNKVIGSNKLELKLASKVLFDTKGYFADNDIKNQGPLPMKVGQETTFTLHWTIATVSSDIEGARVISSLPSGVKWTGKIFPADEKISYNSRTNQIIWEAGNISAGSGILDKAKSIKFQVAVTPQPNQVGNSIVILNKTNFTGKEAFISKDIALETPTKDTQLYEDPAVGSNNGKVAN